MGNVKPRLEEE